MTVHPHAAAFDRRVDDYERGRPTYPAALLAWLVETERLGPADAVLDLGAGTGKLTRLLVEGPGPVVAVEPGARMRQALAALVPAAAVLGATAQALPFASGRFRVVACGQSFRWFANDAALGEIARVLVPGGVCVLVFNNEAGGPLAARLEATIQLADVETPEQKPGAAWRSVLAATRHFTVETEATFDNPFFVDRDGLVARLRSSSQFSRLPEERQADLIAGFDADVERWPADLSQVTSVTVLRKPHRP